MSALPMPYAEMQCWDDDQDETLTSERGRLNSTAGSVTARAAGLVMASLLAIRLGQGLLDRATRLGLV